MSWRMTAKTTSAQAIESYKATRFNALRHGILSRVTVLPWEDADEYRALVEALAAEHTPEGPTEEHLVEELAGILWRKRRLRLAEAATHRRGLESTFASYRHIVKVALVHLDVQEESERVIDAIQATAANTEADIADVQEDETMTRRALDLLGSNRNDAYETAIAALREDTQQWWTCELQRNPNVRTMKNPFRRMAKASAALSNRRCCLALRPDARNCQTGP